MEQHDELDDVIEGIAIDEDEAAGELIVTSTRIR